MKRLLTAIIICISMSAVAQNSKPQPVNIPKDSVVQITVTKEQWQQLVNVIDKNVDSKKSSGEIFEILVKNAALVPKEKK